jgi:hypothetical protein
MELDLYISSYFYKGKGIPVLVVTMKIPRPQVSNIEIIAA